MASEEQLAKAESIRDHAAKGNLPDIKKMVQENLEDVIWWINEGNTRGNTALQLAAMWGHVDCCQELLAAGADKDKQSNIGHTPLMCAAIKGGRAAVVRELIKLGANVNKQDNDGWTALHHAASDGDVVVVRALLEGGASRKIKNEDRKSARKVATEAGNETVVTLFRQWTLFEGDSDEDADAEDAAGAGAEDE